MCIETFSKHEFEIAGTGKNVVGILYKTSWSTYYLSRPSLPCLFQDLACLNRDLSKVIMVEWNPNATELNPRNTLLIPKWTGSDDDRTLIDLAHFLKSECCSLFVKVICKDSVVEV